MIPISIKISLSYLLLLIVCSATAQQPWQSKFVHVKKDGSLQYIPDAQGNIFPDFSNVGYHQNAIAIPTVSVVKTIAPSSDSSQQMIQAAIDELSMKAPDKNGFRGAILLKKGVYKIPGTIKITASGIVLRGEGTETKLIATGKGQRNLISVAGKGSITEVEGTRKKITDAYVPVGTRSFNITSAKGLKVGDNIIVFRPATAKWIRDIQMDSIDVRDSTIRQWTPEDYNLQFERVITRIKGNTIFIDNPVVMAMEKQYGGGEIYEYTYDGRISHIGVENLYCESEYVGNEDEDHGWVAVNYNHIENGWVTGVTSRYFGYSCVSLGSGSKNITVDSCKCLDAKSQITGGRRYSFNNDGQLNLFTNCFASEGRHDYVTGAKVCGPNVFYNCTATNTHADIGPHHRWAMGTLFDNITTDGEINVQDRGNWGTGHGWAGVNQIIWNCTVSKAAIQNPWASGKNYAIGLQGDKYEGRLKGRPDAEWEGQNRTGLQPASLYIAQLKEAKKNR
jgi:hypothetical protein